jgi:DNA-binding MarR family transcriptional regulator
MSRYRSVETPSSGPHQRDFRDGREPAHRGRGAGDAPSRDHPSPDGRGVLSRDLDLPRTDARESVIVKDKSYTLRASEVDVLATIGAFRVVDSRDLEKSPADARHGDLAHLREIGLVDVAGPQFRDGERAALVTLTKEGKELLERHRAASETEERQQYYAGLAKPREALHDAQLYRAYTEAAGRLHDRGARIHRVVLDYELKREYQRFLQAANRGDSQSSGRPKRSREEVETWAREHHLSVDDGRVQFPDVRIEYEHPDGRHDREDVELTTEHYTARQIAGKRASGFTIVRGSSSSRRGGAPFDPQAAARVIR